jgi:hypothetical protein
MIGNRLYREVREISWPDKIEAAMIPAVRGSSSRPASVGDTPLTIWKYSGSAARPPNIPMPRMKFSIDPMPNVRPRNRRSGIRASSPYRRWSQMNAAIPSAPTT